MGGGGYSDIPYIRRLGSFLGFKILNFNIVGGFQKKEYFFFFFFFFFYGGDHHKIELYLGVISLHFRIFLGQSTEWVLFFRIAKI